jgi:hypothetical protein
MSERSAGARKQRDRARLNAWEGLCRTHSISMPCSSAVRPPLAWSGERGPPAACCQLQLCLAARGRFDFLTFAYPAGTRRLALYLHSLYFISYLSCP